MADDQSHGDMLMQISDHRQPIEAEGQTEFHKDDDLGQEFKHKGSFTEIISFDFGVTLQDQDSNQKIMDQIRKSGGTKEMQAQAAALAKLSTPRSTSNDDPAKKPPQFDTITIRRLMDKASVDLFDKCCHPEKTDLEAVIIKRKTVGGQGKPVFAGTFLKVELTEVHIIDISWEASEDKIEETLKMTCRGAKITYKTQGRDGSLLAGGKFAQFYYGPQRAKTS